MKDTSWGHVSTWYDKVVEDDDSYQKQVILPNLLRMMNIKKDEKIIDLACGQGMFTREFKQAGAEVMGADIAKNLIEIARKKSPDIIYHVAPAHEVFQIAPKSVDKVSIVLAIQNIEKLNETIEEIDRIIKPGGKVYLVLNHPAFRVPGNSSWGFDEHNKVQYRRVDSYMSESKSKIDMNPGDKSKKIITYSFHRPLQVYFKIFKKYGFAVTKLEEWMSNKISKKGPREIAENKARKEFPLFMALECKKIS